MLEENNINLQELYEIKWVSSIISSKEYRRISLQFPDERLVHASYVVQSLRDSLSMLGIDRDFYILADTSFGKCCVDVTAALHVQAEVIFHFGHACFSSVTTIPVYYVFLERPFSQGNWQEYLSELLLSAPDTKPWLVFPDICYQGTTVSLLEGIGESFGEKFIAIAPKVSLPHKDYSSCDCSSCAALRSDSVKGDADISAPLFNGGLFGRMVKDFSLKDDIGAACNIQLLSSTNLLFIGSTESPTWTLLLMMRARYAGDLISINIDPQLPVPSSISLEPIDRSGGSVFDPRSGNNIAVTRALMKRFHQIEQSIDAKTIGILVAGPALSSTRPTVSSLMRMIRKAGKIGFVLSMGKLNPNKLANFLELDIFVLVACEENSIQLDPRDYHRPILTPFELSLSLDPDSGSMFQKDWNCTLDMFIEESCKENIVADAKDHARYSFASGKLVSLDTTDVKTKKNIDNPLLITYDTPTSSALLIDKFKGRHYQGLDPTLISNDAIIPGKSGVPRAYEQESNS
jgi:diphthamide biosynthesis protein 2